MKRKSLILLLLVAIATLVAPARKNEIDRNLTVFNSLYRELNSFYVDSVDANSAMETAIRAMLDRIDPYTVYISEEQFEDFERQTTLRYAGIGATIMGRDGETYISEPRVGSPAALAGLRGGDRIVSIDGEPVKGLPIDEVSKRLRGDAGTHVGVIISRPYVGADSLIALDITRAEINDPSVDYSGLIAGDSIGYISLSQFTDASPAEVKNALNAFKTANPNLQGVILDLRSNGGGLLESAVKILGYFLPKGTEVLRTRGREALSEKIYRTTSHPIMPDIPLVVMTNDMTASASEIVAGALQDLDRAVILGERSYGKGLVQVTRKLPYNNYLKVTVAKYYIPSGRLIQAIDYSNRNPDGSVAPIPDSLRNTFHTRSGRPVLDGGGITPDVQMATPDASRLVYNLVVGDWIYNYATRYRAMNPEAPDPATFAITDSIFNDFKGTIDPEGLKYDLTCEIILQRLREAAQTEGYMNDSVAAQLAALEGLLRHNLDRDMEINRPEIERYLSTEIVGHYHFTPGRLQNLIRYDDQVERAVQILRDRGTYRTLLAPAR